MTRINTGFSDVLSEAGEGGVLKKDSDLKPHAGLTEKIEAF